MRVRTYCAHPSIRDHWALMCMIMSRSGDQSEARPPVFESASNVGTHSSTHCSRDKRLSRHFSQGRNGIRTCGVETCYTTTGSIVFLTSIKYYDIIDQYKYNH
ncbi:hypothetical protein TNCV_3507631 [Trichonephila clavipes]|uniref:Uncharacterized protein n=1 Tax=Trichonephila clavipes TaxID=2585209 RepID=A0A8X6S9E0_TRICX|nr:hypothetical protein TNCV_3507631 [Trichonephila clavipes]